MLLFFSLVSFLQLYKWRAEQSAHLGFRVEWTGSLDNTTDACTESEVP